MKWWHLVKPNGENCMKWDKCDIFGCHHKWESRIQITLSCQILVGLILRTFTTWDRKQFIEVFNVRIRMATNKTNEREFRIPSREPLSGWNTWTTLKVWDPEPCCLEGRDRYMISNVYKQVESVKENIEPESLLTRQIEWLGL